MGDGLEGTWIVTVDKQYAGRNGTHRMTSLAVNFALNRRRRARNGGQLVNRSDISERSKGCRMS